MESVGAVQIRWCKKEDCEDVCKLTMEFATYQHRENRFSANPLTSQRLMEDGFGPRPKYRCLVAEESDPASVNSHKIVGYALFNYNYSSICGCCIYLEDLFITEDYRGRSIDQRLFTEVARLAKTEDRARVEFSILGWNKSAVVFYEKMGANDITRHEDEHLYRFGMDAVEKLASTPCQSNDKSNCTINMRRATIDDIDAILCMIKALAMHTYPDHHSLLTDKDLRKDGFGAHPLFKSVVAELEEEASSCRRLVGYILVFDKYSTWEGHCLYLEDIYVEPEYRRLGIGRRLLSELAKMSKEEKSAHVDFMVLGWNKPSQAFYKSQGAQDLTETEDCHCFILDQEGIDKILIEN